MKAIKIIVFLVVLIPSALLAQNQEAKFVQFNNFNSTFEVPAGKTWVINSIFSSSVGEIIKNTDGTIATLPIRIYIKTINGDIKTDYQGDRLGPQVFQSDNTLSTVPFPITLPESTKFSLVIVVGNPGSMKAYNGVGFMTYFEVTNNDF